MSHVINALPVTISALKTDLYFKGESFNVCALTEEKEGILLVFTCINSNEDYLLKTQKNKPRYFKGLDSALKVLKDLFHHNDLTMNILSIDDKRFF